MLTNLANAQRTVVGGGRVAEREVAALLAARAAPRVIAPPTPRPDGPTPSATDEAPGAPGLVSLVGAGPGDPDLITVKGLRRLREAGVVAYDRLVAPALLDECPPHAELRYVGKHGDDGCPGFSQEQIEALLIDRARTGRRVVRLKGGDPFVLGRGGEEALALRRAGIPFEVIPGITSATAVPAYAGIPVTHRGVATSVAIVAGHEDSAKEERVDWAALARGPDTLVVLMGVRGIERITAALLAGGRPPRTPAAAVRWGTTRRQETVTGTLATIARRVAEAGLQAPATLVIGEVVALRDELRWFDVAGHTTPQAEAPRPPCLGSGA